MIWVSLAKRYLGLLITNDTQKLRELYAEDIVYQYKRKIVGKEEVLRYHTHSSPTSITVRNTAYRDKYVCLETSVKYSTITRGIVFVIQFNSLGKINSVILYG